MNSPVESIYEHKRLLEELNKGDELGRVLRGHLYIEAALHASGKGGSEKAALEVLMEERT